MSPVKVRSGTPDHRPFAETPAARKQHRSAFTVDLGQRVQTLFRATADRRGDRLGKALRKVREGLIDTGSGRIDEFLDDLSDHLIGQAADLGPLHKMPADDRVDNVVPVATDRHRELHLVLLM